MPLIAYILACLITALLGRNSRLGFWGVLPMAAIFTPPIILLILLFFGRGESGTRK